MKRDKINVSFDLDINGQVPFGREYSLAGDDVETTYRSYRNMTEIFGKEKISEILDNYYKHICDIIDYSDYLIFPSFTEETAKKYTSNLCGYEFDFGGQKTIFRPEVGYNSNYCYDIHDENAKQFVKDNITFNFGQDEIMVDNISYDTELHVAICPVKKSFIADYDDFYFVDSYLFVKGNKPIARLERESGLMYDYALPKELKYTFDKESITNKGRVK